MSEFHVNVVRLGPVTPHPNADALDITNVHGGYPCIVRKGDFREGDLAVYLPVDSVVPANDPRFAPTLGEHTRIKARRIRGVFSMGLLVAADPGMAEGDDVTERWGIKPYDPPEAFLGEQNERDPGIAPVYDLEGWRRWIALDPPIFGADEEVVVTEKMNGENARFAWHDDRLWCGSHTGWKRSDVSTAWWDVGRRMDLAGRLSTHPGVVLFGEIVGHVTGMAYGAGVRARSLYVFDAMDAKTRAFFNWDDTANLCRDLGLPTVPVLYRGPFREVREEWAEGMTTVPGAKHIREGFVVKPLRERRDDRIGRVTLKLPGQGYLTRGK